MSGEYERVDRLRENGVEIRPFMGVAMGGEQWVVIAKNPRRTKYAHTFAEAVALGEGMVQS